MHLTRRIHHSFSRTARAMGKQAGIQEIHAEVLPSQKADHIKQLQAGGMMQGRDHACHF